MLKKYRVEIVIFYVLAAAALVCAYFYDLSLDIALNDPENPFAVWMRNTGEMPSRLICPLAGMFLMLLCKKRWQRIFGALISLGGSVYLGYYFGDYFFVEENRLVFSLVCGFGFGVIVLFVSQFISVPKKLKQILVILSVIGICVLAAELLITGGMKLLWGRVRYRDLLAAGSNDAFTSFLKINGYNGNRSFPSGHTASAATIYLAMFLPQLSKKCRQHRWLCFCVPFVYTSLVAYTRLVMGAHYLSDVAAGGVIGFTCVLISIAAYDKICKKNGILVQS